MNCPGCGHVNRFSARFCSRCCAPLTSGQGKPTLACPRCGRPHRLGARFCAGCRAPLAGPDQPPAPPPFTPSARPPLRRRRWLLVVAMASLGPILVLLLGLAALLLLPPEPDETPTQVEAGLAQAPTPSPYLTPTPSAGGVVGILTAMPSPVAPPSPTFILPTTISSTATPIPSPAFTHTPSPRPVLTNTPIPSLTPTHTPSPAPTDTPTPAPPTPTPRSGWRWATPPLTSAWLLSTAIRRVSVAAGDRWCSSISGPPGSLPVGRRCPTCKLFTRNTRPRGWSFWQSMPGKTEER